VQKHTRNYSPARLTIFMRSAVELWCGGLVDGARTFHPDLGWNHGGPLPASAHSRQDMPLFKPTCSPTLEGITGSSIAFQPTTHQKASTCARQDEATNGASRQHDDDNVTSCHSRGWFPPKSLCSTRWSLDTTGAEHLISIDEAPTT
jgi:hypothetical protein